MDCVPSFCSTRAIARMATRLNNPIWNRNRFGLSWKFQSLRHAHTVHSKNCTRKVLKEMIYHCCSSIEPAAAAHEWSTSTFCPRHLPVDRLISSSLSLGRRLLWVWSLGTVRARRVSHDLISPLRVVSVILHFPLSIHSFLRVEKILRWKKYCAAKRNIFEVVNVQKVACL